MGKTAAGSVMVRRNDVTVKIDAELVRLAKIVSAYKNKSLAEYISDRLWPLVNQDLEEEQARTKPVKKARGSKGPKEGEESK
jgi:hypothetical protein